MTYFLKDVADYLFRITNGDLRNTLVVFPNQRARLFFNHFLAKLSDKPLWAPKYYSIADFIQNISELQIADPLSLYFKMFKTFREVTGSKESFDTFYYYSEMILADFDDIDKQHVDPAQLYMNLADLKALEDYYEYLEEKQIKTLREFWEVLNESVDSDEKHKFISIWDAMLSIYQSFNTQLEAEQLAYEGRAYRVAINKLDAGYEGKESGKQIAFVGFNALNHSEELLFDHFKKQGNALFFWDYDVSYLLKDYHEAGYFLRKYLKRFPQPDDFPTRDKINVTDQEITTVAVPSNISQAKLVSYCMELLGTQKVTSPLETALILADERLLLPVVSSLPESLDKINISMGYPLTESPAYNLVKLLINLQKNKRVSGAGGEHISFYSKDVFAIFHHELLNHIPGSETYRVFEQEIQEKNMVYIPMALIPSKGYITELIVKPVSSSVHLITYLRDITEAVASDLTIKDAESKHSLWKLEVLQNMHKVLTRFEVLLDESGLELSQPVVIKLLQRVMAGLSVPFSGEPLNGLQVMGILETRTLDFKNIIVLSMNEGVFPKSGHVPSFIPFTLREGFGLPTVRHQDAIFSYYFYRLLHRASKLVLVYNTKTDGMQQGEPSRFIQQLKFESDQELKHTNLSYRVNPLTQQGIEAEKTDLVIRKLQQYWHTEQKKFLSPSAINCYLNCQLKFFFRYIEEIREPKTVDEKIEANVFGSILHKCMKLIYEEFGTGPVTADKLKMLRNNTDHLNLIVERAFNDEYFKNDQGAGTALKGRNLIVRNVIMNYVQNIVKFDESHAPFNIYSLEEKYQTTISLKNSKYKIRLGGYIDRIDIKECTTRIVDYKTGSRSLSFKNLDELFKSGANFKRDSILQSFMYSWLIGREGISNKIQPALYFVRELSNADFDPLIKCRDWGNKPIDDFVAHAGDFEVHLLNTLEEIFNEQQNFSQTVELDNCKFCEYSTICQR